MLQKLCLCFFILSVSLSVKSQDKNVSTLDTGKSVLTEVPVFTKVETEAYFKGGLAGWRDYIIQNLDPDLPVRKGAPSGKYRVIVKFIVSGDGKVTAVSAETKFGYGMEKEAIRLIKDSPDWIPATQGGKNVSAYHRQPITFVIP